MMIKLLVFVTLAIVQVQLSEIDRNIRIVGGSIARFNQFPHVVGLILHTGVDQHSFCGGNIIHPAYILTAAHCFDDAQRIEVLAGAQRIFGGTPPYRASVAIRDMRPHPRYNRLTLVNDIGLLFLLRRINFNNAMQSISLPPRTASNNRFVGSIGTVIGWGRTSDASQATSNELRFIQLPIIADQNCIDVYNRDFRYFNPTNICVSGERGSTCNGDSGGGMHLSISGRNSIIGIVSYGSKSCEGGIPPVLTRITSYLDWISANTGIVLT